MVNVSLYSFWEVRCSKNIFLHVVRRQVRVVCYSTIEIRASSRRLLIYHRNQSPQNYQHYLLDSYKNYQCSQQENFLIFFAFPFYAIYQSATKKNHYQTFFIITLSKLSLNSLFNFARSFLMSFFLSYFTRSFFFQQFVFFRYPAPFFFLFFSSLLDLCLFRLVKIVNV